VISWLKHLFESQSYRNFRESRKDLHENRHEMQRSVSAAMETNRQSSKALKIAEQALKKLEKHRDGPLKE
jgi:hypothetical protein